MSDLAVDIDTENGVLRAVDRVSFEVRRGEVLGLVGESGSGKSITALALLGLLPDRARVTSGSVSLLGADLVGMDAKRLRTIRGRQISMVFQDPLTSLNPLMTVERQLVEAVRFHDATTSKADAARRAGDLLATVGFNEPGRVLASYPHELSGGMRQRVVIVMAMINSPDVLVADEPTTALDVTTQAQVLDALQAAREAVGSAMILISHDLGLVGERADRVHVMYAGRIMETGSTGRLLGQPAHPYTVGLLASRPSVGQRRRLAAIPGSPPNPLARPAGCPFAPRCSRRSGRPQCDEIVPDLLLLPGGLGSAACHFASETAAETAAETASETATGPTPEPGRTFPTDGAAAPLLRVDGLVKEFRHRGRKARGRAGRNAPGVRAVDDVSFEVAGSRTLALVGESGSGKSTIARSVLRLVEPTTGRVELAGTEVTALRRTALRQFRTRVQLVQQDPYSALNPRITVGEAIGEALRVHGIVPAREVRHRVGELLESVGLRAEHGRRFPHEFSGGQRQRICIARALSMEPDMLILDEPVSSLDVSIQAQILNLLADIQADRGLAYLFITHDLAVVRNVADDVIVLYQGSVVEHGPVDQVLSEPLHPYTQVLLAAVPDPARRPGSWVGGAPADGTMTDRPAPASTPHRPDAGAGGCPFAPRCPRAVDRCLSERPLLGPAGSGPAGSGHTVACHLPGPVRTSVAADGSIRGTGARP
ncbi:MAG: ABC transporter ATP-binding protein [Actinomycetota bacterium]|nr:ABC transporter ATP-binding protein [Actinomycetota bacterium]